MKLQTNISGLTLSISIFIILSASFMRQLLDFIRHFAGDNFNLFRDGIIFLFGLGLLFFVINKATTRMRLFLQLAMFGAAIIFLAQMKLAIERIHIIEYGLLGYLITRDLLKTKRALPGIVIACLFTCCVGIIDELFQAILPYRFYDTRDIMFNSLGGLWGVSLFLSGGGKKKRRD
jgi:ABC-type phosphate/phosphonate transport system permease subunit